MRKTTSFFLCLAMVCSLSIPAFAVDKTQSTEQQITSIYGIPTTVLDELPADIYSDLVGSIDEIASFSVQETYVKISHTSNGDSIATPSTYQEYLRSSSLRNTDENDWMRIHTTIIDYGSYGQISASYTWLTYPKLRMNDVIGLSITQGTVIDDTADGFYTYTTSQGSFTTDFSDTPSKFDYEGHGLVRNVVLAKPNYPVNSDFMFMRCNIYKESSSEGLNGAYGHQRVSVTIVPSFNIDRSGVLSCVGLNVGMTYDRFQGYTSIQW